MPHDNVGVGADEPLRFGHVELHPAERWLKVDGEPVVLGSRAFDLLLALAERRGRLVAKQELLDLVWPGLVVEEHNVATQISTLRKWLGASAIATVPGRGYRLTLPFSVGAGRAPDAMEPPVPAAPVTAASFALATRLPQHLTPLLGRDDDLAALAALLQRCRLVTVVGAGGMGKTLLAQHLLSGRSRDYAQGVCWVELASVSDAAALPLRIADALGVRAAAGEPLTGLAAAVAPMAMLVALDNAEHLLDDVARIAAALLEAAPGLRLLVTSQAPLRLAAERVYRVGPLAAPQGLLPAGLAQAFSAVALFVERARALDAHFVLTDANAPAAIELCRQLDGLPLAIELAAARAPLMGVARLAAAMQDRLKLLTRNRDAAAPERQQTLRAALEWSHGLLDERERAVFRRLGVMADSASLAFIQQVVADEQGPLDAWAVLDALGALVDRSLVTVLTGDESELAEPRYRLLESPRLLAIEQLQMAGEDEALRRRHGAALAAAFDTAWDERWSGRIGAMTWANRLLPDAGNAREAIRWSRAADEPGMVVTIAATLFHVLPRSAHSERMALADLCEALAGRVAPKALQLRAWLVAVRPMYHHRQQQSLAVAERAVATARELDRGAADRWPLYSALSQWICAAAVVAQPATDALREALREMAAMEDGRWPAQRLRWGLEAMRLANVVVLEGPGQAPEQLRLTRRVVETLEAEGQDTAPIMGALIDAELECGHTLAALQLGERVLAQLAETRDEWSRMMVRSNLALTLLAMDDAARARPHVEEVWSAALRFNLHALCSDDPAMLAALEGRARTAALLAGYSDALIEARGLIRHPNEVAARTRTHAIARTALGDASFERLLAEGRQLRDEQVATLAFATEDSR